MALFPKITQPCPYKGDISDIMDGTMCRQCKREVHDLTHMSDQQRATFLEECETDEVCVKYYLPRAAVLVATSLLTTQAVLAQPDVGESAPGVSVFPSDTRNAWGDDLRLGGVTLMPGHPTPTQTSFDGEHKRRVTRQLGWDHFEVEQGPSDSIATGAKRGKIGASKPTSKHKK